MKEISERFHINESAIRYYEKEGLLPFIPRTEGGMRTFTDNDVEWMEFIMMLKNTGMSVKNIRKYINSLYNEDDLEETINVFKKHLDYVNEQIALFQKSLNKINYTIWELEKKRTEDK